MPDDPYLLLGLTPAASPQEITEAYQPPPPPNPRRDGLVQYVDGARGYHSADVAPLGYARVGQTVSRVSDARQCSKFNGELLGWFELQRRNATMTAKQLYSTWSSDEQAAYAAKLGSTRVPRDKARAFGVPCPECRP